MKSCTKHWLVIRLTSLPLVPLFFYFLLNMQELATKDRMEFIDWVQQPVTAGALGLFVICAFYHACLGMEEIIVDYVSEQKLQFSALLMSKAFFSLLGLVSLYTLQSIYFGTF